MWENFCFMQRQQLKRGMCEGRKCWNRQSLNCGSSFDRLLTQNKFKWYRRFITLEHSLFSTDSVSMTSVSLTDIRLLVSGVSLHFSLLCCHHKFVNVTIEYFAYGCMQSDISKKDVRQQTMNRQCFAAGCLKILLLHDSSFSYKPFYLTVVRRSHKECTYRIWWVWYR